MIEVENLGRRYGDFEAVAGVSFTITRGEVVGLLGHNGAGKTTMMKVLTGFLEPSAGRARVEGLDVVTDRRAVQELIGYLPENCPVYPEMTVFDYLAYQAGMHGVPAGQRASAIRDAIDRTWLGEKAQAPIATLSRGYRQRVGVAQAILHRPRILILDEPTNGLDPTQIQQMRELIRELARTTTVILSTHILQEVQAVCDRVLVMRRGRLVLDAWLEDLERDRRLQVTIGGAPGRARSVLKGIPGVADVRPQLETEGRSRYGLSLGAGDPDGIAQSVAQAVLQNDLALYEMRVVSRDLETLFRELNQDLHLVPMGPEVAHG